MHLIIFEVIRGYLKEAHCDIRAPTKWQLTVLLLWLGHWCETKEMHGALWLLPNGAQLYPKDGDCGIKTEGTHTSFRSLSKYNPTSWLCMVYCFDMILTSVLIVFPCSTLFFILSSISDRNAFSWTKQTRVCISIKSLENMNFN